MRVFTWARYQKTMRDGKWITVMMIGCASFLCDQLAFFRISPFVTNRFLEYRSKNYWWRNQISNLFNLLLPYVAISMVNQMGIYSLSYQILTHFLGQFYDLLELFNVGGDVKDTNYIFMVSDVFGIIGMIWYSVCC